LQQSRLADAPFTCEDDAVRTVSSRGIDTLSKALQLELAPNKECGVAPRSPHQHASKPPEPMAAIRPCPARVPSATQLASGYRSTASRHLLPPAPGHDDSNATNRRRRRLEVRSANFGVLAAVQLHDVGVVAAPRLCDVGVLAAVQLHETEAAPGEQLVQVPHPAYAREGGGEDRAAKQHEPADD